MVIQAISGLAVMSKGVVGPKGNAEEGSGKGFIQRWLGYMK